MNLVGGFSFVGIFFFKEKSREEQHLGHSLILRKHPLEPSLSASAIM